MTVQAWCDERGTHLFNMERALQHGDIIEAHLFKPASPEIRQPTPMDRTTCPICNASLFLGSSLSGHSRGSIRFEEAA